MKKLLKPLDIFLLGLSGAVDMFNDFKDPFGFAGKAYENMYGWIPKRFRKTDYYNVVNHALTTGYIEKIIKNGESYFRLTSKGREKSFRDFSILRLQKRKWDGKWRLIIFDIKENERKNRDVLRLKLRELGFGMIQESVWITPHDIAKDFQEFINSVGLSDNVFVMEVNHLLAGDIKSLANKIWHLDDLNLRYEKLFCALTELHDRVKTSMGKSEKKKVDDGIIKCRNEYLQILIEDPCLSAEFLPKDWFGEKVKTLVKK